jgi:hypothetical protein
VTAGGGQPGAGPSSNAAAGLKTDLNGPRYGQSSRSPARTGAVMVLTGGASGHCQSGL